MADMFLAWRRCTEGGGWKVRNMFSMTAYTDLYIRTGAQGFPVSDGGEEAIGCLEREADKDSSLDPNFTVGSDWAPGCFCGRVDIRGQFPTPIPSMPRFMCRDFATGTRAMRASQHELSTGSHWTSALPSCQFDHSGTANYHLHALT